MNFIAVTFAIFAVFAIFVSGKPAEQLDQSSIDTVKFKKCAENLKFLKRGIMLCEDIVSQSDAHKKDGSLNNKEENFPDLPSCLEALRDAQKDYGECQNKMNNIMYDDK